MRRIRLLCVVAAILLAVSAVSFSQSRSAERYNTSGDRIVDYFDVHAAELRSVLRQLSAYSGVDIICSEGAKATVSLAVSNKSWREILGIISMVHNLAVIQEPSFVYVMSKEEGAKYGVSAGAVMSASPASPGAAPLAMMEPAQSPLVRQVIPLKFTTAAEMSPALTPFLTPQGRLTPVQHTNSIILVDTDENLKELRKLIDQIDIQTVQVSISCKIIKVSSGMLQTLGVHWDKNFNDANKSISLTQFGDAGASAVAWPGAHSIGRGTHGVYGILSPERLAFALEYLFEDDKAEMVAQPQITTLNNKEAKVFMGQQVPINTLDDAGNTITQMINAGTQLTVTPYVAGEGKVMLSLIPKKETATLTEKGPIISEQSAETNVLVNNGETVVIAGLTENERSETEGGIPYLKNIPIIGNLFKRSTKDVRKTDLVIFVTPHIIHPGM